MPEFSTVSVQEAQVRTIPGRQGQFINEYAAYIQQLPQGQAGKLSVGEEEKHTAIRRRLATAAKAMNIHLIIKRSGNDLYFWREDGGEGRPRRGRRPRTGRPGGFFPPPTQFNETEAGVQERTQEETTVSDQPLSKSEYLPIDKFPGMVAPFEHDLPSRP
jgi:hypothetical protein